MKFIPTIRKDVNSWRVLDVSLSGKTNHNTAFIAKRLQTYFTDRDGVIFICNSKQILVLVRMGTDADPAQISTGINDNLPRHSCTTRTTKVTAEGLLHIQVNLQDMDTVENDVSRLFSMRQKREEDIVMVVDDDSFIRSVIAKAFEPYAKVVMYQDDMDIVETYLDILPDIVFLDIHMPGISGIDVLEEIIGFDDSAHIVMISIDSNSDNVLAAKKLGAKGFARKPFAKEKLQLAYNKSPTVNQKIKV